MSVIVKGMDMPKNCWGCQFGDDCGETVHCNITGESQIADKRHDCPLIEIPPHGRLIDADALEITEEYEWIEDEDGLEDEIYWRYYAEETIEDAPTIIEAED